MAATSFGTVKSKRQVEPRMERSSHPRMRWRTKVVGAYALTFAAVATLIGYLPFSLRGSSPTIASTFLSSLKASYLPPGWQLILPHSAQSEVDTIASILLAFLVCYPIAAYGAIRLVSPPDLGRKTIAALVVGAAFVFYGGAAWGLADESLLPHRVHTPKFRNSGYLRLRFLRHTHARNPRLGSGLHRAHLPDHLLRTEESPSLAMASVKA